MTIAERRRTRVEEFVTPSLQPGERVVAILGFGQTGPSPWFYLLTYLIVFWIHVYAIVVTDQRVLFVRKSMWTNRPKRVELAVPRAQVAVAAYKPPSVWGSLTLTRPDGPLKLNVPRIHRDEAQGVVDALAA
jgi:hypothetical protein